MASGKDKHSRIVRQRTIMTVCVLIFLGGLMIAGIIFIPKAVDAIKTEIAEYEAEAAKAEAEAMEESGTQEETAPEPEEPREEPDIEELMDRADEIVSDDEAEKTDPEIRDKISVMTNRQRIAQLFFITPECLTGVDTVTAAGDATLNALSENQVGGIVYFPKNMTDKEQLSEMLHKTQLYSLSVNNIPLFLGVEEEGGELNSVASNDKLGADIPGEVKEGIQGGLSPEGTYTLAAGIGKYLSEYGFNLDFAPVADTAVSENSVMAGRAFGDEESYVSDMAVNFAMGLKDAGITACYKHFPGLGRAEESTDDRSISINTAPEELKAVDVKPFQTGIENGAEMIMVANALYPGVETENVPACMSNTIVTDYLKGELNFKGVVITDDLKAKGISDTYDIGEAAVNAFKAGCDMLLLTDGYPEAFEALLGAYESGQISNERLEDALERILKVKKELKAVKEED